MSRYNHLAPYALAALGFLILIVAASYHLSESPGIWYDEGFYTQVAMNLSEYGSQFLQIAPDQHVSTAAVTVGYPLLIPVGLSYHFFGVGVMQGRAVMVLFIVAFGIASYLLIFSLFGPWYAGWSLLILSSLPLLYGNGKSVLGEVPGAFFVLLCFLGLVWLERTKYRDWRAYVAVGLSAGLAAATKPIFLLLPPALLITLVLHRKRSQLSAREFLIASVAFLAPVILWICLQFGAHDSFGQVLAIYSNPYEVKNIGGIVFSNLLRFVTEATPAYMLVLMVLWGAALWLRKRREVVISSAEVAAFSFSIVILAAYLRLDGWYRYFFPATLVALIFLPKALGILFEAFRERFAFLKLVSWLPFALLAVLFLGQSYQLMHSSYVAQYYQSHRSSDLTAYLATLNAHAIFFVYDVPETVILLPGKNYYQYLAPHPGLLIGASELPVLASGIPNYVITGGNLYFQDPAAFARYKELKIVNRYIILTRSHE